VRNKLTRIRNKLLEIIFYIDTLQHSKLPDDTKLGAMQTTLVMKDRIDPELFSRTHITKAEQRMHQLGKHMQFKSEPWHVAVCDDLLDLKEAAKRLSAGVVGQDDQHDRRLMKKGDNVRKRLVIMHNLFQDILRHWTSDIPGPKNALAMFSDKEMKQELRDGLNMEPLPVMLEDFGSWEAKFYADEPERLQAKKRHHRSSSTWESGSARKATIRTMKRNLDHTFTEE